MARQRIVLEDDASVTGATTQDYKGAVKVGSAKSGVAVFIMHTGAASMTGFIETSPFPNPGGSTATALWNSAGFATLASSAPAITVVSLTNLMDVLRWRIAGTNPIRFTIILYLYDT